MKLKSLIAEKFSDYELDSCLPVAAFDIDGGVGVDIIDTLVDVKTVVAKDTAASLDWVVDCSHLTAWHVLVGDLIVVELDVGLVEPVAAIKDNCFLWTKCGWAWLVDRSAQTVEFGGAIHVCWIAERCSASDCALIPYLTMEGQRLLSTNPITSSIKVVAARSVPTMELLDGIHRDYIYKHKYVNGDVIAVSSVAGSGKTTMLLRLSQIHSGLRILYLAFNKSLVTEILGKIKTQKIKNLSAMTFDSLLWHMYCKRNGSDVRLCDLRPQNIGQHIQWLQDKPFKLKRSYCKNFSRFCLDTEFADIEQWCLRHLKKKDVILERLWTCAVKGSLVSFETIRKQAFVGKWFKTFIDTNYDMVLCDETQDFDMIMLRMLLDDTTVPKVFVGDPKQSIYEFRGCINAFKHMPASATIVEFYSTFRIGEPACSQIRKRVSDLWMISKSGRTTEICSSVESGVWLFRTWKVLLQTARLTRGCWIYGFDSKLAQIRSLHTKLNSSWSIGDDDEDEDDLPKFLKSISKEELEQLISDIERNLVLPADAVWSLYTVHSYKGMENDFVRMASDITLDEENLYYVAITRGMKKICLDSSDLSAVAAVAPTAVTAAAADGSCDGKGRCLTECKHKPHMKSEYGSTGYCPSLCKHKCVPEKCMFWSICKQRRPKWVLEGSKGQCFDCRVGL